MERSLSPLAWFGGMDIYLIDQLQKGRIAPGARVLDAGCGGGRNLDYFLLAGHPVSGLDQSEDAIAAARERAARLAPALPPENFRVGEVDALPFPRDAFDLVVSIALLHFARDEAHFRRMTDALWGALAPGGLLVARVASTIGIESLVEPVLGRTCRLPDKTTRFLVDLDFLLAETARLGATLADPIKTTNVQNLRAMTTWTLWKPPAG